MLVSSTFPLVKKKRQVTGWFENQVWSQRCPGKGAMCTPGLELHQALALDLCCLISLSFRFLHDCSKNNSNLQSLVLTSCQTPSPALYLI